MKVIEIVRDHLKQGGFDGLVQTDAECGCLLGDLAPCGDDFSKCEPGYRGAYTAGHIGEWSIFTTKEAAIESIAQASKQWPNPELSGPKGRA